MKTYKYTDSTNTVVHIIDEDGISRSSCLASILESGTEILPADPEPVVIPTQVSMRQARLALLQANLLDTVNAAMASMPQAAQIEWEYATTVDRNSSLVSGMTAALSLTTEQLDQLFVLAASL